MATPDPPVCDTDDAFVRDICANWPDLDPEQVRKVGHDRELLLGMLRESYEEDAEDSLQKTLDSYMARESTP